MKSKEQLPEISQEDDTRVLEKLGRSKLIKKVAIGFVGLSILSGAIEGGKKVVESADHPTPIEYVQDTSGYKAELSKDNLNNPNTIFRLVSDLPSGEKPYVLVHAPGMKPGQETRVGIKSEQDLEAAGADLTDLGVAAREVLLRDQGALMFGREHTPALKEEHVGVHLQEARDALNSTMFVGAAEVASPSVKDPSHPEKITEIDATNGGYVKVVEPATPSLER